MLEKFLNVCLIIFKIFASLFFSLIIGALGFLCLGVMFFIFYMAITVFCGNQWLPEEILNILIKIGVILSGITTIISTIFFYNRLSDEM